MATLTTNPVIKEILNALGLKNVVKFELKMQTGDIVRVNIEYYPEIDGLKQLPSILAKYQLVPLIEDVTTLGDEYKEGVPAPKHFVAERDLP